MPRNKTPKLIGARLTVSAWAASVRITPIWIVATGSLALMSCGSEQSNPISDQDNRTLDEAAAKLDAQTPAARAQSIADENADENSDNAAAENIDVPADIIVSDIAAKENAEKADAKRDDDEKAAAQKTDGE